MAIDLCRLYAFATYAMHTTTPNHSALPSGLSVIACTVRPLAQSLLLASLVRITNSSQKGALCPCDSDPSGIRLCPVPHKERMTQPLDLPRQETAAGFRSAGNVVRSVNPAAVSDTDWSGLVRILSWAKSFCIVLQLLLTTALFGICSAAPPSLATCLIRVIG